MPLAGLLLVATSFVPSPLGLCFEGSVRFGFPFPFVVQCFSPSSGSEMVRDPAEWQPIGLVADAILWYLVAFALVLLYHTSRARGADKRLEGHEH